MIITGRRFRSDICQLCNQVLSRAVIGIPVRVRPFSTTERVLTRNSNIPTFAARSANEKEAHNTVTPNRRIFSHEQSTQAKLEVAMRELKSDFKSLVSSDTLPSEEEAENFLTKCINVVERFATKSPEPISIKSGATSALLELDKSRSEREICKAYPGVQHTMHSLSDLAFSVMKLPKIPIGTKTLHVYVALQASLGRPETLPEILRLFAHKPIPFKNKSLLRYSKQNSNMLFSAIPAEVAKLALQTAIQAKQLVAALDIIEAAYTTREFKISKCIRKALVPTCVIGFTPYATYSLASQLAHWQTSMETALATNIAFLGIVSYIGLTGTMALVSISTSNDQMDRVTWAPGLPLGQRWLREEERAAIDQVAGAWGFSESWHRGEEEGEDWDLIKEWVSRRAMVLDKVELMEGMS